MAGSSLIGNLAVNLSLETAAFQKGASLAEKQAAALGKKMQNVGASMTKVGAVMSAGITAPFAALMSNAIPAAMESRAALAQVEQGLKTMGGASGKTAEELKKSARELQRLSTYDDDDILRKVTANMITFGNVSGDAFDRAQKAAIDLSARLGQDLQSSTIQIGKALNDPIKGITALSRVGVSFTEDQKAMIKAMAEAGDVAGAQAIILNELEKQYGGSAKAARDAAPGSDTIDAWRDFQETIGGIALKVLPPFTNILTKVLELFNNLSPSTQTLIVAVGAFAAAIGPVLLVLGPMVSMTGALLPLLIKLGPLFTGLVPLIATFGKSLAALAIAGGPITIVLAAAAALYLAFKNWDTIEPIVRRLYTAVKTWLLDKLNAVWDGVKQRIDSIKNTFKDLYTAVVGNSYIPDMVEGIAQSMAQLGRVMVDPTLRAVDKVEGAFQALGSAVGQIFGSKAGGIISQLGNLFGALKDVGAFGGKRAMGGPVIPNRTYLVGEKGPELLRTGSASGHVIPNHAMGGGSTRVVVDASPLLVTRIVEGDQAAMMGGAAGGAGMVYRRASRRYP